MNTAIIFLLLEGGSGVGGEAPGYNFYAYNISNNSWENLTSIPCPIGEWVGNRLRFANGHIYYWQGAPTTEKWICGGDAFFMFDIDTAQSVSISVSSTPSGAGISFDGLPINAITPYTITDVEPSYHTIKLTLEGYSDWSKSVNVKEGETSYVNAILTIPQTWIVINEDELNPPEDDMLSTTMERVELYNPTSNDINLGDWTLSSTQSYGGKTFKISGTITIKANGYYAFGRSRWLHNTKGESAILRDDDGTERDRTPRKNDDEDNNDSWQRYPNGKDTNSDSDWVFQSSTKGYSNGE